eukprot:8814051-Heterocapsa_arctica.AAC.1
MFIRYCQLCLNGDVVMMIPPQLIVRPDLAALTTLTAADMDNPWLRMAAFIQEVLEPQLTDAGKEEAKSFRDLLESKTQALWRDHVNTTANEAAAEAAANAVAAMGNAAPGTEHTDPMFYVIVEDAEWK